MRTDGLGLGRGRGTEPEHRPAGPQYCVAHLIQGAADGQRTTTLTLLAAGVAPEPAPVRSGGADDVE